MSLALISVWSAAIGLSVWVIASDWTRRIIPNVAVILTFALYGILCALDPSQFTLSRLVIAAGLSVIGTLIFISGRIGGGDVKLLPALSLFVAPANWALVAGVFCASLLAVAGVMALQGRPLDRFPLAVPLGIAFGANAAIMFF